MRKKAMKAIIVFFSLMALLTIVSRAADSVTIANVTVERAGNGSLTHESRATGIIEAGDISPVWAIDALRVENVAANPGDEVKKGDAIIIFDAKHLSETIANEKLALKKLTAQLTSQTSIDMEADLLLKRRALNKAIEAHDDAKGTKNKRDAAESLALIQEEFDIASRQWEEKLAVDEKAQTALAGEILALTARIDELERLLNDGAALRSPYDAVIVTVDISMGKLTGSEAVAAIAKAGEQLTTCVTLTSDQAKYVQIGDKASVQGAGRREWKDGYVAGLMPQPNGEYSARVSVGDETLSVGQTVMVKFSKKTDNYSQCVPLSALYGDSSGDYVLILEQTKSVLGDVTTLRRVTVTVLDRDMTRAAISASLMPEDKIVIKSDKPVSQGARVREA